MDAYIEAFTMALADGHRGVVRACHTAFVAALQKHGATPHVRARMLRDDVAVALPAHDAGGAAIVRFLAPAASLLAVVCASDGRLLRHLQCEGVAAPMTICSIFDRAFVDARARPRAPVVAALRRAAVASLRICSKLREPTLNEHDALLLVVGFGAGPTCDMNARTAAILRAFCGSRVAVWDMGSAGAHYCDVLREQAWVPAHTCIAAQALRCHVTLWRRRHTVKTAAAAATAAGGGSSVATKEAWAVADAVRPAAAVTSQLLLAGALPCEG